MYILWLVFMALVMGFIAVPIIRAMGYSDGRMGQWQVLVMVIGGALLFGALAIAVLSLLDAWDGSSTTALIIGFAGAVVTIGMMTLLSARAASHEDDLPRPSNRSSEYSRDE